MHREKWEKPRSIGKPEDLGSKTSNRLSSDLRLTLDRDWGFGSSGRALMAYNSVPRADDRENSSERCSK